MEFRRSLPKDGAGIAAIEAAVFPDPWQERDIIDLITTEGAMCFSAVDGDSVVAYFLGRLIPPEGELYRVAVIPEKRQRGVGYCLLDYAYKTSKGRGLESLFLEVRSQNTPAIKLYEAYGFERIGLRRRYYKNPEDDAIIMLKGKGALFD